MFSLRMAFSNADLTCSRVEDAASSYVIQTGKANSRNLVIGMDGTSNCVGQNIANIFKLFGDRSLQTDGQSVGYTSGAEIGVETPNLRSRVERSVSNNVDMSIAWSMQTNIQDAYDWLTKTYSRGDKIFLFGFSRGAHQTRVLAGMPQEVSISTKKQTGMAYGLYEAIRSPKPGTRKITREWTKWSLCNNPRAHVVRVWDRLSSAGLIRGNVFPLTHPSDALVARPVKFTSEYLHERNLGVHERNDHPDVKSYFDTCANPRGVISGPKVHASILFTNSHGFLPVHPDTVRSGQSAFLCVVFELSRS
ncbi:hypothetical protein F5I97DRAFT_1858074 [Phlebopus sp. FC_14]|nr:hypothetical protein F5I97DRAFT_1858074 [Phlebopus sp. FC_14]